MEGVEKPKAQLLYTMQLAEPLFGQSFLRKQYGTRGAGLLFFFFVFFQESTVGTRGESGVSCALVALCLCPLLSVWWVSATALQLRHANANTKMEKKKRVVQILEEVHSSCGG